MSEKHDGDLFFVFEELVRGPKLCTMRTATPISALCVALFCGYLSRDSYQGDLDEDDDSDLRIVGSDSDDAAEIRIKSWVRLTAPRAVAEKVAVLRLRFETAFMKMIETGKVGINDQRVADCVANLVMADMMGKAYVAPLHHPPPQPVPQQVAAAIRPTPGEKGQRAAQGGQTKAKNKKKRPPLLLRNKPHQFRHLCRLLKASLMLVGRCLCRRQGQKKSRRPRLKRRSD